MTASCWRSWLKRQMRQLVSERRMAPALQGVCCHFFFTFVCLFLMNSASGAHTLAKPHTHTHAHIYNNHWLLCCVFDVEKIKNIPLLVLILIFNSRSVNYRDTNLSQTPNFFLWFFWIVIFLRYGDLMAFQDESMKLKPQPFFRDKLLAGMT